MIIIKITIFKCNQTGDIVVSAKKLFISIFLTLCLSLLFAPQSFALTLEEVASRLDKLEQQNKLLRKENKELRSSIAATDEKAEAAVVATEAFTDSTAGIQKVAEWANRTTIGGYGELHYNNLSGKGGASDKDEIDFHRFVLFFGHEFTDDIRFFSELELEHSIAGDGKAGEIELEQAYIDFDLNDNHTARAGLFLLPVGIINETHEPPTFYGTERNPIEKNIVPATWWAAGAGLHGQLGGGFSYDAYVHSGLNATETDSTTKIVSYTSIRSGRQKVSEAVANDPAVTGRLKYTGIPGLELAVSAQYQQDIGQGLVVGLDSGTLIETHAIWNSGPFGIRALYAAWDINGTAVKAAGADKQEGFYVEPSFKISDQFGVFARFNQWDNEAGSNTGDAEDTGKEQWDIGINYWPHEDVVIKADYQYQNNDNGSDQNGLNVGLGYQF
ncbi:MAG: porin [Cycloclasticus sp. symbiont of Poecilosclerida sp. M]|nr:MAG: porin [Cycloclasticus sp. symbiont of Poecilosclerida sp. M]